jgi:hypothetical protein
MIAASIWLAAPLAASGSEGETGLAARLATDRDKNGMENFLLIILLCQTKIDGGLTVHCGEVHFFIKKRYVKAITP